MSKYRYEGSDKTLYTECDLCDRRVMPKQRKDKRCSWIELAITLKNHQWKADHIRVRMQDICPICQRRFREHFRLFDAEIARMIDRA